MQARYKKNNTHAFLERCVPRMLVKFGECVIYPPQRPEGLIAVLRDSPQARIESGQESICQQHKGNEIHHTGQHTQI